MSTSLADETDLRTLAWAYLRQAVEGHDFSQPSEWLHTRAEYLQRFEAVAKSLGEHERRQIIDAMDTHQARKQGDEWQVEKMDWGGFWSTPADKGAVLRVADRLLADMDEEQVVAVHGELPWYWDILQETQNSFLSDAEGFEFASDGHLRPVPELSPAQLAMIDNDDVPVDSSGLTGRYRSIFD